MPRPPLQQVQTLAEEEAAHLRKTIDELRGRLNDARAVGGGVSPEVGDDAGGSGSVSTAELESIVEELLEQQRIAVSDLQARPHGARRGATLSNTDPDRPETRLLS